MLQNYQIMKFGLIFISGFKLTGNVIWTVIDMEISNNIEKYSIAMDVNRLSKKNWLFNDIQIRKFRAERKLLFIFIVCSIEKSRPIFAWIFSPKPEKISLYIRIASSAKEKTEFRCMPTMETWKSSSWSRKFISKCFVIFVRAWPPVVSRDRSSEKGEWRFQEEARCNFRLFLNLYLDHNFLSFCILCFLLPPSVVSLSVDVVVVVSRKSWSRPSVGS